MKQPPCVVKMKKRLKEEGVELADFKIPLSNGESTPRIKDILEDQVDEKYYLKQDKVDKITQESGFKERLASITKNED